MVNVKKQMVIVFMKSFRPLLQTFPKRVIIDTVTWLHLGTRQKSDRSEKSIYDDYSHNWKNLWEDNTSFSQVLVENALVKVISGVFDLSGL